MQTRRLFAQGTPQGGRRKPPEGMPERVPFSKPAYRKAPARDALPPQQPITDEPAPKKPARWKTVLKRFLQIAGLLLVLAFAYVFLLMGEPGEDDQLASQTTVQEETIGVPMAASEVTGTADLNLMAANFGKPVMARSTLSLNLNGLAVEISTSGR